MSELNIDKIIHKLKMLSNNYIKKQDYEKALNMISCCSEILYLYNQSYFDSELENDLTYISQKVLPKLEAYEKKTNTLLFYDGFAHNSRGLIQIYINALIKNGYRVIYVTYERGKGNLPDITRILESGDSEVYYLSDKKYIQDIYKLAEIIEYEKPEKMFMYTNPDDVVVSLVFEKYEGKAIRYQINLTDHAFWLGRNAFDFCIEFRDYGASISYYYRKIPKAKIRKLPFYPSINNDVPFAGVPFLIKNVKNYRFIFSGGSLYKTFGDNNKYYKIVEYIIKKYDDICFWYAGGGKKNELYKLKEKYPDKVFWTTERKDLYEIMLHCYFYLSTYPLCGNLMTQYAAAAGKIPLTLKNDHDTDEMVLDQDKLNICFDSIEELEERIDYLIMNPSYVEDMKEKMIKSVLTEENFNNQLQKLLSEGDNDFNIVFEKIDTTSTLETYRQRLKKEDIYSTLSIKKLMYLIMYFPASVMMGILSKVHKKLKIL